MTFCADQFEQTAAWLQYCDGMTQFQAETEAARRQGILRVEALRHAEKHKRNLAASRDRGEAPKRHSQDDMPAMQRGAKEQDGPMSERDVQA
jgi:hypothetical protein